MAYTEQQKQRKRETERLFKKNNPMAFAYMTWKSQQKHYNRVVDLSFDEFKKLWDDSGVFHLRGNHNGCFMLIRNDFEDCANYENLIVQDVKVARSRLCKYYRQQITG